MSTKRKASAVQFTAPSVKTAINVPNKTKIDETRTSISAAGVEVNAPKVETIEISSDEASDSDEDDEIMGGVETTQPTETTTAVAEVAPKANGVQKTDSSPEDDSDDGASPSFGELLRGTIDVPALLSQNPDGTLGPLTKTNELAAPSLDSLGTVLTQALRTEDTELLESCLQVTATDAVQQTVSRLDSALAGVLLTKLAARFHRRPGRAGSLMAWVKWTLVAHGGALAIQPGVLDRLTSLQRVLNERSRGLPSLLALKGKLDMLDAQMQLRAARQRRTTAIVPGADNDEQESSDDDDDDAIYVEGEEAHGGNGDSADELEDEVALATSRGFAADSDVDDDLDDIEEIGDSEADEDDLDEDDVDHDDLDDSPSDDDSDAEAAPPSKVQKTARTSGKRR
ncbi:Dip2/Utp12 family-domain-containing protein [Plectosphaerella plurivora]|uniref:Dip2/Utp12 family-domain-containing protein n=1 Tax=Plectosphaerella plurivora TaxID=936078 RepID=A0A9P9A771_9PEZI|nr:Dip2/Utp12 family-domain-containing protein [Plectosphaerella plurivora]